MKKNGLIQTKNGKGDLWLRERGKNVLCESTTSTKPACFFTFNSALFRFFCFSLGILFPECSGKKKKVWKKELWFKMIYIHSSNVGKVMIWGNLLANLKLHQTWVVKQLKSKQKSVSHKLISLRTTELGFFKESLNTFSATIRKQSPSIREA